MFGKKNIVEVAVSDGRFNTLVAAVKAAGLVDTLKGKGPFTVLAPTDEAFKKLPAGTVEGLLKDIPALKNILLYHVIPAKAMSCDVMKMSSVDTVQGTSVKIEVKEGSIVLNGEAKVIVPDVEASNGVIHAIDMVILPPKK
ncbi:MAG: fasciclin domain-containing protein [Dehalococcoidia bacterium]|nr:MAG: fasciclin domain-containing protein [Dehalococcoidia bacterium]